ncbi:SoxR reducing system RseC family protein [Massilibacteroides sp.]|uniref:SoxR reducing system RseC family protein n=1 Tax=Massilibacteroides sp. TaxID=2034766 RepID=UPI002619B82D|nr:SoxR reducing system RseC family protein [Massilibacteroides sp.]MDD4515146.1 SoxR reducing system RseC family protein [Massilibacteroides sp.]
MDDTIHHTGIIERIDRDKVYVKIIQQSACAGCHAKSMCNASESKDRLVEIDGIFNSFQVNEVVDLYGRSSLGYLAVLYAFVLPLIILLAVVIFCLESNRSEAVSALAGLAVLPVYYSVLYFFKDKLKKRFVFAMRKLN